MTIIDPKLREYATPQQAIYFDAIIEHGGKRPAARALKVAKSTIDGAMERLEKAAARQGYAPGHFESGTAAGFSMGKVTVQRWVAAFSAGRILNEKTTRGQLMGGIVWGIGQALLEETIRDCRGRIVNPNLADYLVPVNADVPGMEILLVPEKDTEVNPAGAKGLGELGICGASAAIANAIFHATGRRFRDLPIKAESWFHDA